jgi:glycosyltransferase involved in cell wall biosynthesis
MAARSHESRPGRDNRRVSVPPTQPRGAVGVQRGDFVVCIAAGGGDADLAEVRRRVREHSPDGVRIVVCDSATPVSEAVAGAAPADVVLLCSDCHVAEGWLDGLRAAAYVDAGVATAIALSNDGELGPALRAGGSTFDEAAASVRARSLRLRPRVSDADGPCVYVRRSALELAGDFERPADSADGLGFAARCLQSGLCHVIADDVLVLTGSSGRAASAPRAESSEPVARSLGAARRALGGLSLVIDARGLAGPMNGTKVHVLELIAAVARTGRARVTALVPADLAPDVRALLDDLPDVTLAIAAAGVDGLPPVHGDIVHRPFQISAPADLTVLASLADRLLITHQDLISYHNPSYFPSSGAWHGYRDLTRTALAAADRVLFFSNHVRDDALAEDLVEPHRASVVHIGVDHTVSRSEGEPPTPPARAARLPADAEMILCLGTDFRHKNRIFALRVLEQLQRRHGWSGWLVMAGPRAAHGSSRPDEERILARSPQLSDAVLSLDAVSEAEKTWLLHRATLVLYPTVHEGFGLVPFEAADHGVPCLWAEGTALSEVLPDEAAGIVAWDAAASADRALELLRGEDAAARNLSAIRASAAALSWDATAERLIALYHSVCDELPAPVSALERRQGMMRGGLSEDAMRLVGPDGALPGDLERPLLALATHPKVGVPVFRAIKAGYRVSYRWRRSGSSNNRNTE